jgi:nitroreductase
MTLYEAVFIRRSVRKFDMIPLRGEIIDDIKKFITETRQMNGQKAGFEVVSADAVNGASAPHYILSYSAGNDDAFANVGYVMQKADLYIQSIGLGSLWLGMTQPKNKRADFCILLAFGKTDVPQRKGIQDFNRLPLNQISNADNAAANTARLAPSAMNTQPWKLFFEDGKITINYFGRGFMKAVLKNKLNKIDLGIVTRHIETALLYEGKEIRSINPKSKNKSFAIEIIYGP